MIEINNDQIQSNKVNLDINYGPYSSVDAAHSELEENEKNKVGVTVGIIDTATNTITEYWYQGGTDKQHLVKKQTASVEVDSEPEEGSPKAVSSGGVYTALQEKANISDIPIISKNITNDATSDTKTASPKAVKTYVDNGLTGKQDIISAISKISSDFVNDTNKTNKFVTSIEKGLISTAIQGVKKGNETLTPVNGVVTIPSDIERAQATSVSSTQNAKATIDSDHVLQLEIPRGADAINPFKGWFTPSNKPTSGQEGDYCYVTDDGITNVYKWNGTIFEQTTDVPDTDHTQSFASNESVNQVAIDNSHLVNPVNTADSTQPVLSRAEDVMIMKQQLRSISLQEDKVELTTQNVTTGYKILGTTGLPSQVSSYDYLETDVTNHESVRFLGIILRSGLSDFDKDSGYAFGHYNGANWVTDKVVNYEINTENTNGVREYIEPIPEGSTHFRCASRLGIWMPTSSFYCYLETGSFAVPSDKVVDYIPNHSITWDLQEGNRKILRFEGNDSNTVIRLYGLKKGEVYRVYKPANWVQTHNTKYNKFFIKRDYYDSNNVIQSDVIGELPADFDLIPSYFDIIADDAIFYSIGIRADVGETVDVLIEKIDISANDINLSFDFLNGGYCVATTGENYDSGSNTSQSFKHMRPTLGKKYLDLTWMIFLSSASDSVKDRGLAWYDRNGNYIGGIRSVDVNESKDQSGSGQRTGWEHVRIKIPHNACYFNATYYGKDLAGAPPAYAAVPKRWKVYLTDKEDCDIPTLDGNFSSFIGFAPYDGPTGSTMMSQDYNTFIGQWDAVKLAYPSMVTEKNLLGYATAAGSTSNPAQPNTDLPIYEYVVKPLPHNSMGYEEHGSTDVKNTVKVLIVGGVHGAEKPASTAVLELVKNIVGYYQETKADDKWLSLAQNCEFHIIPCVNPTGYNILNPTNTAQRLNARGVNINRNFGHNWSNQVGNNTTDKGPSAYSELETQIVRDWIAANKDALIYVDSHTSFVGSSPLQGLFNYAFDFTSKCLLSSYVKIVSVLAQQKWPTIFTQNQYIGFLGFVNQAWTSTEARYVNGIPRVATLEVNTDAGDMGRAHEEQTILALNQIVNYIRMCINEGKKQ